MRDQTAEDNGRMPDYRNRRLKILGQDEIDEIYGLPRFSDEERELYFSLTPSEEVAIEICIPPGRKSPSSFSSATSKHDVYFSFSPPMRLPPTCTMSPRGISPIPQHRIAPSRSEPDSSINA